MPMSPSGLPGPTSIHREDRQSNLSGLYPEQDRDTKMFQEDCSHADFLKEAAARDCLQSPPEGIPTLDHIIQRLVDFAYVVVHEELVSEKKNVSGLIVQGHPLAVKQAQMMWEKMCASQVVDCLPLRSEHAPNGKHHMSFMCNLKRVQDKYPQVMVEIQPMISSHGPAHQLQLSCGDDELLLACRGELWVHLKRVFPGEYAQILVHDTESWTKEELAQLQESANVLVLMDRQRSALQLCGSTYQVADAVRCIEEFESARRADRLVFPCEREDDADIAGFEIMKNYASLTAEGGLDDFFTKEAFKVQNECIDPVANSDVSETYASEPELASAPSILNAPCEHSLYHWYYIDDDENIQGPFETEEMREWWDMDFLPADLAVCCLSACEMPPNDASHFYSLEQLFQCVDEGLGEGVAGKGTAAEEFAGDDQVVSGAMHSAFDELGA